MTINGSHLIEIAGLKRELPLLEVQEGLRIAVLNILGDTELVEACAVALKEKLSETAYDVIVTAEAKSIPLAYALAVHTGNPYVVLRKTYKPYMGVAMTAETLSITTGKPQTLILDEKDHALIKGKKVILLDDVVSTGSTLKGMRKLMGQAKAEIAADVAILTEGDPETWADVISLGHIPLFTD